MPGLFTVLQTSTVLLLVAIPVAMFGNVGGGGFPLFASKGFIAWHAVLMTWAFGVMMPLGRWAYHVGTASKEEKRYIHRIVMTLAALAVLGGYASVFMAHWPKKRYFGYDFSTGGFSGAPSRFVHIFLGYSLVFGTIAQAIMGMMKYQKMAAEGEDKKIFTIHGTLGKAVIVGGGINIMIAAWFWGWEGWLKATIALLAAVSVAVGAFLSGSSTAEAAPLVSAAAP